MNDNDEILSQVKTADNLRAYVEQITEPGRERGKWVCPLCGSGNGPRKSAAFSLNGDRWKCFSCQKGGDLLDLIGEVEHIDGYAERLHRAAEICGVWHDEKRTDDGFLELGQVIKDEPKPTGDDYAEGRKLERAYIETARTCIEHPDAIAYLEGRGIDLETARAWGLGYDPNAGGAKRDDGSWCARGRIVIPWPDCDYYHVDRSIDPNAKERKYDKPKTNDVGPQPTWNRAALRSSAFFVVEGALDALAIEAAGGRAVALCGTGSNNFVADLAATGGAGVPILLLDMDEPGRKASTELAAELKSRGIFCLEVDADMWGGSAKDAGEAWQKSPGGLSAFVTNAKAKALEVKPEDRPKPPKWVDMREYLREGGAWDAERQRRQDMGTVSTGLKHLDNYIGGGLTPDLYLIGGGPGMGKTTIALQIADHVAAEGWPVLYVCTEQTPFELACKSVARTAYLIGANDDKHKMTALSLIQGYYPVRARAAVDEYTSHQTPVVIGADFDESIESVREKIDAYEAHIRNQGVTKPLTVVIDYLQLLRSEAAGNNASEREITDRKVSALKAMQKNESGQARIMIVLSSLNREAYRDKAATNTTPTLASFKESGSIEYTAAVAIMLWRFAGIHTKTVDIDADQNDPDGAVIRARIVKNRYGRADRTVWILHNKEVDHVESMAYQDMVTRGYVDAVDDTEAE